jgi:hypothetical protein
VTTLKKTHDFQSRNISLGFVEPAGSSVENEDGCLVLVCRAKLSYFSEDCLSSTGFALRRGAYLPFHVVTFHNNDFCESPQIKN